MINFLKKYQKVQWMIFSIALLIYINTIPNKWAIDDNVIIYTGKVAEYKSELLKLNPVAIF